MLPCDLLTKINEYEAANNRVAQIFNELDNWFKANVDNDVVYTNFSLVANDFGGDPFKENVTLFIKQYASYGTAGCYYLKVADAPLYICADFIG